MCVTVARETGEHGALGGGADIRAPSPRRWTKRSVDWSPTRHLLLRVASPTMMAFVVAPTTAINGVPNTTKD